MSDRPVWLLDVDGVINATYPGWPIPGEFTDKGKPVREAPKSGMAYAAGYGFKLRWSPSLIHRLRLIIHSDLVDVTWATTWVSYTDNLERLWGLPSLSSAWEGDRNGLYAASSKMEAAEAVLESGRPLVWTDDDVVPPPGPEYDRLLATGRALLIKPNSRNGLRPEDFDAIEEFIGYVG